MSTVKAVQHQVGNNATDSKNIVLTADVSTGDLVISKGVYDGTLTEISRIMNAGGGAQYVPAGTGAVATTVETKLQTYIDAQDYIATPGASNASDQTGVQAAINYADSIGGGIVRVRPPISTSWNIQSLTVPVGVIIEDLRRIDLNNIFLYGVGGDTEFAISGTSVTAGEGPSFVGVNNATTGDRTVSLVARYGNTSTGASVNCYMHMGVWDGTNWFPEFDQITSGSSGFRSNWRVGYGTAQLNAGITGAAAYTAGQILVVNRPFGMGTGMAFEVDNTVSKFNTEIKIQVANAPLRFCAADGTPNWTFLDQYPSAAQFTLYDHNTSTNKIIFTSAGDTVHLGVFKPSTDNTVSIGTAANRWSVVYAGTGTINTSDAREKQQIRSLSDTENAVAVRLKSLIKAFKFNDAVQAKGDAARIHVGVIAQEVIAAFEAEGLDANRYAIVCYDEWAAELDDDGNEIRPAGNRYGVRYEELLAFIISAL